MATEKRLIDANKLPEGKFIETWTDWRRGGMMRLMRQLLKRPPWMPWKWCGVRIAINVKFAGRQPFGLSRRVMIGIALMAKGALIMDLPYQVFDSSGVCIMHAPESCRYPRRIELSILEAGYTIRLHGKRITKTEVRKETKEKNGTH